MNEIKSIYVNGCSFSCSGGMHWEAVRKSYKDIHNIDITDDNVKDYGYANLIAKHYNLEIINESIPGGSTNRLIRKTYEYIHANVDKINETIFILELPPGWRDEFYSNVLNRTINLTCGLIYSPDTDLTEVANGYPPGDVKMFYNEFLNYFQNFVDFPFEDMKTCNNLVGLLSFIKLKNLKYILIDGIGFEKYLTNKHLQIDEYNFCKFDSEYLMYRWFVNNKLTISDELGIQIDGHAGVLGNKKISDIVIKYIKKIYPKTLI
jgi:hypothetical protein